MSLRPRRKPVEEDPADPARISFAEAHRMETEGSWQSPTDRRAFWRRDDVPAPYRESASPDPRALLRPDADYEGFKERERAFEAGRAAWLEAAARA